MKTEWICNYRLIPGGKWQTQIFSSQQDARKAMAKLLADTVDLHKYIQALRRDKGDDCGSSADFLERFLADLTMPETEEGIPDCCDIPDHCLFEFDCCDGFRWGYMRGECPFLSVGFVYEGEEIEPYVVSFNYESPKCIRPDRVNAVEIRIRERINYGNSANPFWVLFSLHNHPQTQEELANRICRSRNTRIDRKAVGRHLELLQDLGFPIRHSAGGYYLEGSTRSPVRTDRKYSASAYPFLILQVLDDTPKTQAAIIRKIQEVFGVKMDRKAVVRNMELLADLDYPVEKCKKGYFFRA